MQKYQKIGGWLRILTLLLALGAGMALVGVFTFCIEIIKLSDYISDVPAWYMPTAFAVPLLANLSGFCLCITMFIFILRKNKKGPGRIRILLWARCIILLASSVIDYIISYAIFHSYAIAWDDIISQKIQAFFPQLILTICWAAYMKQSTRVSVYFGFIEPDFLSQEIETDESGPISS